MTRELEADFLADLEHCVLFSADRLRRAEDLESTGRFRHAARFTAHLKTIAGASFAPSLLATTSVHRESLNYNRRR